MTWFTPAVLERLLIVPPFTLKSVLVRTINYIVILFRVYLVETLHFQEKWRPREVSELVRGHTAFSSSVL